MMLPVASLLPLVAALAQWAPTSAASLPSKRDDSLPTVTLDYSTVQAVSGNSSAYFKYQNIRFAKPPVGELRFASPEWPDVENVTNVGTLADADVSCKTTEDCLFVDVYAPAYNGTKLPVLVW
jgi:carboxylesterase type B